MENFPNLMGEKVTQIQETQRGPSKRNPKRPTLRHIIFKMAKFQNNKRILKTAREEQEKKQGERKEQRYKGNKMAMNKYLSILTLNVK